MAPFHLLDQDDQNEMQHYIFDHMMPLALVPCGTNGHHQWDHCTHLVKIIEMRCNITFC